MAEFNDRETLRLKAIVAKTLRKAKRWYLGYVICQLAVLGFAILCVTIAVDTRLIAVIAFVLVLFTECVRWRSEFWKSEGEFAKRRWELADGFGAPIRDGSVADWLACRPADFLSDVSQDELRGSTFESSSPPGPRRIIENVEESAWWSKHESRLMAVYLGIFLVLLLLTIFVSLTFTIGALRNPITSHNREIVQNVGAIICAILAFVFSINIVRLFVSFLSFFRSTEAILARCHETLGHSEVDQREALLLMFDYQTARSNSPLLPTFLWKLHGHRLRREWHRYRPTA
jgi:hypothetical protein